MQSVWLVSLYSAGETEEKRKTKRRQGKERKAEEGEEKKEKYMKDMYGTLDYTNRGTWLGYRFKATTLDLLSNNII